MRYIRLFENMEYKPNRYWKVRTDEPYLSISLDKLGVPKERFKGVFSNSPDYEHVFIFACNKFGGKWEFNVHRVGDNHQKINSEKYMGELEITEEDLKNWEIKKEAEKYNL